MILLCLIIWVLAKFKGMRHVVYLHGSPVVRKERDDISQELVMLVSCASLDWVSSESSGHEVARRELYVP